jgi:hypothetical protein
MKKCNCCDKTLPLKAFGKQKTSSDGFSPVCRDCKSLRDKRYREKNKKTISDKKKEQYRSDKNSIRAKQFIYREKNKKKINEQKKQHYKLNAKIIREKNRQYAFENRGLRAASEKARRENQQNFFKNLSALDKSKVKEAYRNRDELNLASLGAGSQTLYHVDHIYPINHNNFCGLHYSCNLQILTDRDNMRKSNSYP